MTEIAKIVVTNFFFCAFFRVLVLFTLSYILRVKKHTLFNKFLSQEMTANLTGRKSWRLWWKKGNDFLYVVSLTLIIHWIAWTHSTHMQWWRRLFNKGEILAPNRLNILPIFFYWLEKSRVEKDSNKSQLLLCCHATQVWIFNRLGW